MPYPHAMRLHGPWRCEPVARYVIGEDATPAETDDDLPTPGRIMAPADWSAALGAGFRGRALFRRGFNRPTGLESAERVWLVTEGVDASGVASLNGKRLGEIQGYALRREFDVTALLEPRNEVVLEIGVPGLTPQSPAPRPGREHLPGGPIRETRLEVRADSCILNPWLCLDANSHQVRVGGEIASEEPDGLEILVRRGDTILLRGAATTGAFKQLAPTPSEPGRLEPMELLLARRGQTIWETTWLTAAIGEIRLDGGRGVVLAQRPLPWARAPIPTDAPFAPRADCVYALAEVLSEASYAHFDQQGLSLVQALPVAWAGRVAPRLAHHPCLVAWAAPPDELAKAPRDLGGECWFGRPWVARNDVFGEPRD